MNYYFRATNLGVICGHLDSVSSGYVLSTHGPSVYKLHLPSAELPAKLKKLMIPEGGQIKLHGINKEEAGRFLSSIPGVSTSSTHQFYLCGGCVSASIAGGDVILTWVGDANITQRVLAVSILLEEAIK